MSDTTKTLRLLIDGMHCGNCAMNVENHIREVNGVQDVSVSLASNSGKIVFDSSVTSVDEILGVFDNLSFTASEVKPNNKMKVLQERSVKGGEGAGEGTASEVESGEVGKIGKGEEGAGEAKIEGEI